MDVGIFVGRGLEVYCGSFWPGSSENVVSARAGAAGEEGDPEKNEKEEGLGGEGQGDGVPTGEYRRRRRE